MSTAPPVVGSTVYAVLCTPACTIQPVRVLALFLNEDGVVGTWFTVEDSWEDRGLALRDEGILWTRSADAGAHRALLTAYALAMMAE